jgi:hypothetical protein
MQVKAAGVREKQMSAANNPFAASFNRMKNTQ